MGNHINAALGNLQKAAGHAWTAVRGGAAQVGSHLASADTKAAAAIADHGNVWGAMKAGFDRRPVTATVASVSLVSAAFAGHHILSADRSQGPGRGGR